MNVIVVEPPAAEPVDVEDCYDQVRLDPIDGVHPHDGMLQRLITASREWAEHYTRRAFVRQKLRVVLDRFPTFEVRFGSAAWGEEDDYESRAGYVELPRPPFIELSSVKYFDDGNVQRTVTPTNYYVSQADLMPRLHFVDGFDAPAAFRRDDAWQVEYFAGYPVNGTDLTSAVPQAVKQAILVGVQLQYDELAPNHRELLEDARKNLLATVRVPRL